MIRIKSAIRLRIQQDWPQSIGKKGKVKLIQLISRSILIPETGELTIVMKYQALTVLWLAGVDRTLWGEAAIVCNALHYFGRKLHR
jgi:hypothetical protein